MKHAHFKNLKAKELEKKKKLRKEIEKKKDKNILNFSID